MFELKISSLAVAGAMMSLSAAQAQAQAPQTEHNVSMAVAQAIIAGAIERCTWRRRRSTGRMDGTRIA